MPTKPKRYFPSKGRPPENRPSAAARGYDSRWQKASKAYLRQHPLCVRCLAKDVVKAATVVDHKTPHRGDQTLFWNEANWQACCKSCHDRKTVAEDGGLGRAPTGENTESAFRGAGVPHPG